MGLRGPMPKPTILQISKGDPGKRARRRAEQEIRVDDDPRDIKCPSWVKGAARKIFNDTLALLRGIEAGGQCLVTRLDVRSLGVYAQEMALYEKAVRHVETEGETCETTNGYQMASPWIKIRNSAFANAERVAKQFGFTPSARVGLEVTPIPGELTQAQKDFGY